MNGSDTLVTCFFDAPATARDASVPRPAPEGAPAAVARATLRFADRSLTLLAGSAVTCGRHRACDLAVPPPPSEDDAVALRRWVRVSRRHCVFECGPAGWRVRDGGWERNRFRASSFGTWWNGSAAGDGVALTHPGILSLGDPSPTSAVCFDVAPCGNALCVRFRGEPAPRAFALLDGRLELGAAEEGLAGLAVECAEGGFRWCGPACAGRLLPGTVVTARGLRLGIE